MRKPGHGNPYGKFVNKLIEIEAIKRFNFFLGNIDQKDLC